MGAAALDQLGALAAAAGMPLDALGGLAHVKGGSSGSGTGAGANGPVTRPQAAGTDVLGAGVSGRGSGSSAALSHSLVAALGRRAGSGVMPAFAAPPSFRGASPLHLAAAHGHMTVCDVLLRAPGTDPGAKTEQVCCGRLQGCSALCRVLLPARTRAVCILASAHASAHASAVFEARHFLTCISAQGCTALHMAARNGHEAVVGLLLRYTSPPPQSQPQPPGGAAPGSGAAPADAGQQPAPGSGGGAGSGQLQVDAADGQMRTALHYAAAMGHWRVVEELWPRCGGAMLGRAGFCKV